MSPAVLLQIAHPLTLLDIVQAGSVPIHARLLCETVLAFGLGRSHLLSVGVNRPWNL